jgi:hypothetical protein
VGEKEGQQFGMQKQKDMHKSRKNNSREGKSKHADAKAGKARPNNEST